jgi:hypothetical protein
VDPVVLLNTAHLLAQLTLYIAQGLQHSAGAKVVGRLGTTGLPAAENRHMSQNRLMRGSNSYYPRYVSILILPVLYTLLVVLLQLICGFL